MTGLEELQSRMAMGASDAELGFYLREFMSEGKLKAPAQADTTQMKQWKELLDTFPESLFSMGVVVSMTGNPKMIKTIPESEIFIALAMATLCMYKRPESSLKAFLEEVV